MSQAARRSVGVAAVAAVAAVAVVAAVVAVAAVSVAIVVVVVAAVVVTVTADGWIDTACLTFCHSIDDGLERQGGAAREAEVGQSGEVRLRGPDGARRAGFHAGIGACEREERVG